jgi:hypothetical protein
MTTATINLDLVARPSRMVRPKTDGIKLTPNQRPLDYGHCSMILVGKYGKERGEKYYEDITLNGTNAIWIVAQEIQKEKVKMLNDLGRQVPMDLDEVNYFEIWTEWKAQRLYKK